MVADYWMLTKVLWHIEYNIELLNYFRK